MAVEDQVITDDYALYLGDCMEVMPTLPDGSAVVKRIGDYALLREQAQLCRAG